MTSLNSNFVKPFAAAIRTNKNDAEEFLNIFKTFVENGQLKEGDYLILDNASIHVANEIWPQIRRICQTTGINFRRLPAYSPELNPCERVFAFVKNWIRNHRTNRPFEEDLLEALNQLHWELILSFYIHCIEPDHIKSY